jgi:hypothetical protein
LENLKKEYFKNPLHWQKGSDQLQLSFDDLFDVNRAALAMSVQKLLEMGQFTEAPIYIPEVYRLVPNLRLLCDDTLLLPMQITTEEGLTTVRYQQADMRPYVRFLLARELFKYLCRSANPIMAAFFESPEELLEIQANIFAGMLLVPAKMLKAEVETMQSSMDMVAQMADTFWVSKALMNQRLRDLLEHGL